MPPLKRPLKRRRGSDRSEASAAQASSSSGRRSMSRSSHARTSRRSSASSVRGQSRQRYSHDGSQRPRSSASAQTFADDPVNPVNGVPDARQEEYQDVEVLSEVIMAVDLTDRGTIGCAYYVARAETLYFMEDVQMGDAEMVDACEFRALERIPLSELTLRSEALH